MNIILRCLLAIEIKQSEFRKLECYLQFFKCSSMMSAAFPTSFMMLITWCSSSLFRRLKKALRNFGYSIAALQLHSFKSITSTSIESTSLVMITQRKWQIVWYTYAVGMVVAKNRLLGDRNRYTAVWGEFHRTPIFVFPNARMYHNSNSY